MGRCDLHVGCDAQATEAAHKAVRVLDGDLLAFTMAISRSVKWRFNAKNRR